MKEKIIKKLNDHYYRYLHKEKYRNMLNNFLYFYLWRFIYKLYSLKKVDSDFVLFVSNHDDKIPADFKGLYDYAKSKNYRTLCLCMPKLQSRAFYYNEIRKIIYDIKFTRLYAQAKYTFVYDYYIPAFANKPRKGARLIQIWHGCGAFKKWGYSTREGSWGLKSDFFEKFNVHKTYTDIITSSESVNKIYAEAFDADMSKVKALGVSRTDVFFDQNFINKKNAEVRETYNIDKNKKIMLWAPTYRGDNLQKSHNEITFELEKLYNEFKDDYVLIIKLHPHLAKGFNATSFAPDYMKDFAIKPNHSYPIENLLCAADIVISDYSSLIFEYSLLERPMIFYAYDLEDYEHSRSFYYDYRTFVPGEIVTDTDGIINEIRRIEKSFNKERIIRFKKEFMSACDGNSSKRIFDEIVNSEAKYEK